MADFRRRSDYDHQYDGDRRGSHPNPTWRRDEQVHRRPPTAPRSHTMDPKRTNQNGCVDRRPSINMNDASLPDVNTANQESVRQAEPTADPRKRNPSRSPEGTSERKKLKPDQEGLFIPSNNSGSPRSSVVNDRSRETSVTAPTPMSVHSRRQSIQLEKGIASSSARPTAGGTINVLNETETSASTTPILDVLVKFNSDVAINASLQLQMDQAKLNDNKARVEYKVNERNFKNFPSLREQKDRNKRSAKNELESHEKKLNDHKAAQQQTLEALALLIGQASEVKPRTDVVSREEYNTLQAKLVKLETDLHSTNNFAGNVETNLSASLTHVKRVADSSSSNAGQVPQILVRLRNLETDTDSLLKWKPNVDVRKLEEDVKKAVGTSEGVQQDLHQLKNVDLRRYATRKDQDDLETRYETLAQKVTGVERKNGEISKDIDQVQANNKTSNSMTTAVVKETSIDEETKSIVDRLSTRVDDLYRFAKGDGVEVHDSPIDNTISLEKRVDLLDDRLTTAIGSFDRVVTEVTEEGKEPVIKRIKNLDRIVNNLSTQISGGSIPLIQRISQLEHDLKAAQDDLKDMKNGPQPHVAASTAESTVDLGPLVARLASLEDELESFNKQQEEKDELLEIHFESQVQPLQTRIANVEAGQQSNQTQNGQVLDALQQSMEGLRPVIESKLPKNEFLLLDTKVTGLGEELKKLQSQLQRAFSSTPPVPSGLPQRATQSPQMPNGVFATPQIPNGVTASPQIPNGVAPQPTTSPLNNGNAQGLVHLASEQQKMQVRLDQLIGVTQHLKQRADNIQSDEIARQMVDQVSHMYPALKNTDIWIQDFNQRNAAMSRLIQQVETEKNAAVKELNSLVSEAKVEAGNAKNESKAAFEKADKTAKEAAVNNTDITNLKDAVGMLKHSGKENGAAGGAAASNPDHSIRIKVLEEDVDNIRKDVGSFRGVLHVTTETANAADKLSRGHATRFSKVNPEQVKAKLSEIEGTVEGHGGRINRLNTDVATEKTDIESMKAELIKGSAKIAGLERAIME